MVLTSLYYQLIKPYDLQVDAPLSLLIKLQYALHETNSVGNVQSVMVSGQSDVSLLGTVWSDQSVNLLNVNLVQLLDSSLDLVLVSLQADLENQGVTVLNLLNSSLRGNWGLNDLVGVHSVVVRNGLSGVERVLSQLQGLWQSEGRRSSDLNSLLGVVTLQSRFLSSSSLSV